jgi:hypothetical protein
MMKKAILILIAAVNNSELMILKIAEAHIADDQNQLLKSSNNQR